MARIHVHAISCNERELMPFFVAHYRDYLHAQRIVVHYDDATTDRSNELAAELGVETVHHQRDKAPDGSFPLDDSYLRRVRNTCFQDSRGKCDWILLCDIDELWIHPNFHGLLEAAPPHVTVLQPQGWDLVGEWPTPGKQVWECVRRGVTDQPLLNKPCLFRSDIDIQIAVGGHDVRPSRNGQKLEIFDGPQLKLLHCSYLGPEHYFRKQAMKRARPLSEVNVQNDWGVHWHESEDLARKKWDDVVARARPIPDLPVSVNQS